MDDYRIIGRKPEIRELEYCLGRSKPQFVIVYGRRRVGKTYLIDTFFRNRFAFKFTGVYRISQEDQLANFREELSRKAKRDVGELRTWSDAFFALRDYLDAVGEDEKAVVFLDELPWMDDGSGKFLHALEYFWNQYGNARRNLVFIVAGSNTSYLVNKLIRGKGGFFKRDTTKMNIRPFNLAETREFLRTSGIEWNEKDILDCYMVLGGLPYYLQFLRPSLTPSENIDQLLFSRGGALYDEFGELFANLFRKSGTYIALMECVCGKRYGRTKDEIADYFGKKTTDGNLSSKLKALCDCGFVAETVCYRDGKKKTLFRCADYFAFFYFRFVRDNQGRDETFWTTYSQSQAAKSWSGFSFEWVCLDCLSQIKAALGISGVRCETFVWACSPSNDGENEKDGAQIDLVIDRSDHMVHICECKYTSDPYELDKGEWKDISNKITRYQEFAKKKKTVLLTVLSPEGIKKTGYASKIFRIIDVDAFFAE